MSRSLPVLPVVHQLLGRLYSDDEWEALCNRCGRCCYESRWTGSEWVETGEPCTLLNEETLLCRAYGERFEKEVDCVRVDASIVLRGMLPPECTYVEELHRIIEEDYGGEDPRARRQQKKGKERRRHQADPDAERSRRGRRWR